MIEDIGESEEGFEDANNQEFDTNELDVQNGDNVDQVVCILQKLLLTLI